MEKVTTWRRFKGWVIALRNRVLVERGNLLFVTRLKTLAVHLSFALVLLIIFWIFLEYAENQILKKVLQALEKALLTGGNTNASESLEVLSNHLKTTYVLFFAGLMGVMGVVAYFLAGVTLRPIRKNMQHQRRFIADVSHELRTPLSVMQSEAEVALFDASTDRDRKEALRVNVEEINRISLIINNLVSFTHVGGLTPASFSSVNLSSVITRSVEKLSKLSRSQNIEVRVVCDEGLTTFGNEVALEQVVLNLVKNAIYHSPQQGRVFVTCRKHLATQVSIEVKDQGSGIPSEDKEKIFEAFYKSSESKNASRGSVGLGLTIVKEVVRSHSGEIVVESSPGEGASFMVLLPISQRKGAKTERAD